MLLVAGCATGNDRLPPRAVNSPILDYPPEAILERESGILVVLIQIGPDGSRKDLKVKQSTGIPILDTAGLDFVDKLEFLPAVRSGRKEACWAEQKVIFSMERAPLDLLEWRTTTRKLIQELNQADLGEREAIQQRLYTQCANYMRAVITRPDLSMNRMALSLAADPVRDRWAPYQDTFPMSFLMFADFVERVQDPPLGKQALRQLRQSVEVDIERIDQRLSSRADPDLRQLRNDMAAYLDHLQ